MHVKYSTKLTWLVVASGFFFLAIMVAIHARRFREPGLVGNAGQLGFQP